MRTVDSSSKHWSLSGRDPKRNATILLALVLAVLLNASSWSATTPSVQTRAEWLAPKTYKLVNGQWFDGKGFHRKTFYSVNGVLTQAKPPKIDEEVDLENGFVVPPFGEAHNHNIEKKFILDAQIQAYLKDGIYYVKIPNSIRRYSIELEDRINLPWSIDVVFSPGGLTSSGGHPVRLYEDILSQSAYRGVEKGWFNNKAYFIIDSISDLESKWVMIMDSRPNFIKTYLLYSDEFEKRRDAPEYYGKRGLDPKLLPLIVERAHKENLRVSTHVETAADFHNALVAGVDEINHLPGYNIPASEPTNRFQISEEDARLAARKGVFVVTTTILTKLREKDPVRLKLMQDNQVRNLRLLYKQGVNIAIGTDNFSQTSLAEARNLYELKAFDNLTLLKLWSEITPRTIFPNRKIGQLKSGYEASFLVLNGNPIENFDYVKDIKMRFKQGRPITLASK